MKKNILLYIIIAIGCLLAPSDVSAQSLGLSGKRLSVFYNLDFRGAWDVSYILGYDSKGYYYNQAEDGSDISFFKSVTLFRHTVQAEYVLQRNVSVGVFGTYFRDGFGVVGGNLFSKNYQSFNFGASIKFFRLKTGGLAPLGNYFGFKVFNSHNKVHFKGNPGIWGEDFLINETTANFPGFAANIGKQSILYKNILFNISAEIGFVFNTAPKNPYHGYYDPLFGDDGGGLYLPEKLSHSVSANHFLALTFGIGLCPI